MLLFNLACSSDLDVRASQYNSIKISSRFQGPRTGIAIMHTAVIVTTL